MNSGTVFGFFMTDSGLIPEELSNSGAIPADSGHSCGFRCHSSGFRCHSGGITGFRMESVGHCKVLNAIAITNSTQTPMMGQAWATLRTASNIAHPNNCLRALRPPVDTHLNCDAASIMLTRLVECHGIEPMSTSLVNGPSVDRHIKKPR